MGEDKKTFKLISKNRQAYFLYNILETYEAGISLLGTEVKSIRAGRVNLKDGYVFIRDSEALLSNVHISPYKGSGSYFNHDPLRIRKLLLHKKEINKLIGKTQEKGLTLVPIKMYFKGSRIKLQIGLGKGKKLYDKRETVKRRDDQRAMSRAMKQF